jgi:hypothetical protein
MMRLSFLDPVAASSHPVIGSSARRNRDPGVDLRAKEGRQ